MQDVVTLLTVQLVILLKIGLSLIQLRIVLVYLSLDLKDVGMCIVNGRGEPELDNFTSVSSRGKAVVDYCITSYTGLEHVTDFRVHLVTQLCEMLDFKGDYRLPDHSLVSWQWEVHGDMGTTDAIAEHMVNKRYIYLISELFQKGFWRIWMIVFTN